MSPAMYLQSFTVLIFAVLAAALPLIPRNPRIQETRLPIGDRQQATVYYGCAIRNMAAITFEDGPHTYEMNTATTLEDSDIPVSFFINRRNPQCVSKYIDSVQSAYETWRMFGDQGRDDTNSIAMGLEHSRVSDALRMIIAEQLGYKRANKNKALIHQVSGFDAQPNHPNPGPQHNSAPEADADEVVPYVIQVLQDAGFVFGTVAECLGFWEGSSPGAADELWSC